TVRNPTILELINKNIKEDNLHLDEVTAETVYDSQAGGFRHRRDGLSYRLYLKDQKKERRPRKRVNASNNRTKKRKAINSNRIKLTENSFKVYKKAYNQDDFNVFIEEMTPLVQKYKNVMRTSFIRRVLRKVKKEVLRK